MSIRAKPTFVPLRYLLAGYRPSKTAHLALFLDLFARTLGKSCHVPKGGVSVSPSIALRVPPTLNNWLAQNNAKLQ